MLDLIGSTEFGDWLLAELEQAAADADAADATQMPRAKRRLDTLEVAKDVLLEFLQQQQAMQAAAADYRRSAGSTPP